MPSLPGIHTSHSKQPSTVQCQCPSAFSCPHILLLPEGKRESRKAGKQSLYPLLIQLDVDFSNKPSDPCALSSPGIVPGRRWGMQESWGFTCAEKIKIINGLLALVIKGSPCCNTGCSRGDQSLLHTHNQGELLPRSTWRAGMWQKLPRSRGLKGAVPGQAGLCTQHVQPFRARLCSWDDVGMPRLFVLDQHWQSRE